MPTTIYDSISSPNDGCDLLCGPIAISFSPSATTPVVLNRVGVSLCQFAPGTKGMVQVSLCSNDETFIIQEPPPDNSDSYLGPNGIAPRDVLVDLGSISDTALTAAYQTFYFRSNFVLLPSTRYWIVLTEVTALDKITGACLGYSQTYDGVGVAGEYFWNWSSMPTSGAYGAFVNSSGPYQMQVDVEP